MYRVSIELYKHEWKFERTRNAMGTRAAGECFHSFFEFSQTFTSVCITRYEYMFSISFRKQRDEKKENNLLTLIIKILILFAHVITTSTACASSVSPMSYTNTIFNQSARVLSQDFYSNITYGSQHLNRALKILKCRE